MKNLNSRGDLEWRPVVGYEDHYDISNYGHLMSYRRPNPRIHEPYIREKGYRMYKLSLNTVEKSFLAHRLVAEAFIPNPENKPYINHIDGNPNNNHISNLEWCTPMENVQHAIKTGLTNSTNRAYGEQQGHARLTETKVINIRHCRGAIGPRQLAVLYNVHKSTIQAIWYRRTWKHI